MNKASRFVSFLRTTGIGGIVFLLPLVVLGALIGQAAQIVLMVADVIGGVITVRTPLGITLLLLAAVGVLLLLCFGAGLLAQRSFARTIHETFEKYLLLLFPRYSIFKDQLSGTLGGTGSQTPMQPVLVQLQDTRRLGFRMDTIRDQQVVVYLPGAPDPWSGQVICVEQDQLEDLHTDFGETVAIFERLGRGAAELLGETEGNPADGGSSNHA